MMDPQRFWEHCNLMQFGAEAADEILNARADFMRFIDRVYRDEHMGRMQLRFLKSFAVPMAILTPKDLSDEEKAALKAKFNELYFGKGKGEIFLPEADSSP